MAKADILRPDGTRVKLEGTPEEIAAVVTQVGNAAASASRTAVKARGGGRPIVRRATLSDLLENLQADGFFKEPKELGAVREELATRGHHYPRTTVAPALLRQVRRRVLRRLKHGNRWVYTA